MWVQIRESSVGLSLGTVGSDWGVVCGFKPGFVSQTWEEFRGVELGICGFRFGSILWV